MYLTYVINYINLFDIKPSVKLTFGQMSPPWVETPQQTWIHSVRYYTLLYNDRADQDWISADHTGA